MSKFKEPVLELRYLLVQINLQLLCKYWPSSVNYGPMYTLARTGHNWMRAHYVLNYAQEHDYWLLTITQWGKVGIVMCRRFVFAKMKRSYCGATNSHWHRRLFDILMQCWNLLRNTLEWRRSNELHYLFVERILRILWCNHPRTVLRVGSTYYSNLYIILFDIVFKFLCSGSIYWLLCLGTIKITYTMLK